MDPSDAGNKKMLNRRGWLIVWLLPVAALLITMRCRPTESELNEFGSYAQRATKVTLKILESKRSIDASQTEIGLIKDAFVRANLEPLFGPGSKKRVASLEFDEAAGRITEMFYYGDGILMESNLGHHVFVRLKTDPIAPLLARP